MRHSASTLKNRAEGLLRAPQEQRLLVAEVEQLRLQLGRAEARVVRGLPADRIDDSEFRVFSQFGEDGIIQFLLAHVPIEDDTFVEFGVQSYAESNTRFLLCNDNWRGLIIDGDHAHLDFTLERGLDWRHDLTRVQAFIDRDNINSIIAGAGVTGDIGLLSVDIDGNDLWVLRAIDVISPRILITEYNSTWGPTARVSVPYAPDFVRERAHSSNLFWGASLAALASEASAKGYALVGGNDAGNNAFFVRRDVLGELPERSVESVYRASRFRESLDTEGRRSYLSDHRARLAVMRDMEVFDLETDNVVTVAARYGV